MRIRIDGDTFWLHCSKCGRRGDFAISDLDKALDEMSALIADSRIMDALGHVLYADLWMLRQDFTRGWSAYCPKCLEKIYLE